jgi:probable phosphoglycerate mutase
MRQARFRVPPGATQLLLVRHGESAPVSLDGPMPRCRGQADPALDPVGASEAEAVAERLAGAPLAAIYHSPLRRAAQTAAPLARALGLEPVEDDDLREVFLGQVDGLNLGMLVQQGDERVRRALREQRWELIPDAEPQAAFAERVRAGIGRIVGRHPGQAVAVFTHGGVIGEVLAQATGATAHAFTQADNGSITHLVASLSRWTVRGFNDTGHLGPGPVLPFGGPVPG